MRDSAPSHNERVRGERAGELRPRYEQAMLEIRGAFEANPRAAEAGTVAVASRAALVDELIRTLWAEAQERSVVLRTRVALVAVGGYGRSELFPFSDVDVMFLLDPKLAEKDVKDAIRGLNQQLWDVGLRLSPMTRTLTECERFNPENVEFTLALLDARWLDGERELFERLVGRGLPRLIAKEQKKIVARVAEVTRVRHRKYGDTLFHLEPNIKDCPGGLRDAHLCAWLGRLGVGGEEETTEGFKRAREFVLLVRTFLHFRRQRDDNTLDWQAQDEAAAVSLGLAGEVVGDAAYWMRLYFRNARSLERAAAQVMELAAPLKAASRMGLGVLKRLGKFETAYVGFEVLQGSVMLKLPAVDGYDPAHDPEVMLALFAVVAGTGARLAPATEARLEGAVPYLSMHLEDGPGLWRQLEAILTGIHAGLALRTMHAIGVLELLLPEFHAIDALVIRDAYHRYTVDEHTFVLIDTLHGLTAAGPVDAKATGMEVWASRFGVILRDLPHPGLLFLAALMHDTGKGHSATGHAGESVRMAESVVRRLELDTYESGLVLGLIRNHLEMSATLRRDVFAVETIKSFASRVPTPEALRMLTVFTYADISAVHPDALTPWKAENLHHLYVAAAHYLDRNVDEDRIGATTEKDAAEVIHRVAALVPGRTAELDGFLAGLPQRYLLTRSRGEIKAHFEMARRLPEGELRIAANGVASDGTGPVLADEEVQLSFQYAPERSELTLVSRDREMLFANMAGALAAWGMNIVTADAFSNAHHVVVDTFRFTDTFRTLELNESERERFVGSVREIMTGTTPAETMLAARRRGRKKAQKTDVTTRIQFDDAASMVSTLIEVVAQDTAGLLRALTLTLAARGCNIEVALVDTEGEMAIDVFYVTRNREKLGNRFQESLRRSLMEAIEANAR